MFWDVQHGSSCYINTPNGRHWLIDLGSGSYKKDTTRFSPILHLKNKYNVQKIDYLTVTHPHLDHIDDILNLECVGKPTVFCRPRNVAQKDVMHGIRDKDRAKFEHYFHLDESYDQEVSPSNSPSSDTAYGGLVASTFQATRCDKSNLNNQSMIQIIEYSDLKIIVCGDNEKESFEELMRDTTFVEKARNTDLLVAPHHGRDSGYYEPFVTVANPRLTVVSDGSVCDTSAVSRYGNISRGWKVHSRKGGSQERRCITTRKDGVIVIRFGPSNDGGNFLSVKID